METTTEKIKRKYTKFDWSGNELMGILRNQKKSIPELSAMLNIGKGTCLKYFKNPLLMSGAHRKIVADYLGLTLEQVSAIIDK